MKNLPTGREIDVGSAGISAYLRANDDDAITIASGVTTLQNLTGDDFSIAGDSEFSLTAAGGIITYTGEETREFLVHAAIYMGDVGAAYSAALISKNNQFNGDAIGASVSQYQSGLTFFWGGGTTEFAASLVARFQLAPNDTIRVLGGNASSATRGIYSFGLLIWSL